MLQNNIPENNLPERYRAYEQSAEGLWMFQSDKPVSVKKSNDYLIKFWEENCYLADCNDNMAKMYGFEKREEILGTKLNALIDFSDPEWIQTLHRFIENGFTIKNFETKEPDRNGNLKYFMNAMVGIVENEMLQRVWGTQQDITEMKRAEHQLQQSELFYRNLISESLDGIILTDENGLISFVSPRITSILGYSVDEVLGNIVFDFVHPDDRNWAFTTFRDELLSKQNVKFINIRLINKQGELIWCMVRGHNMFKNPYVGKMAIYFSDDSLRKQAEDALIKSEKRYREQATILNNVTDVIVTTDLKRNITSWNKVIEKLTGIASKDALGRRFRDVLDSSYAPFTHDQVAEIVMKEGIWRGEISFTGSDGEKKYILHTVSIIKSYDGENIGMLGVGKDITDRKKAETRMLESEQFFRKLNYYSIDGIIMSDRDGIITYSGPSVERISGYNPVQLLGKNVFDFIHHEDIAAASDAFTKELHKQSVLNYIFLRLKHSSGEWIWCTVRGHNLLDVAGLNSFVIYFTIDTERKQAEDRLRKSEQGFRNLIYNLTQGVILIDQGGMVSICNQTALDMLGITESQILGKSIMDFDGDVIHEDGTPFNSEDFPVNIVFKTGQPVRNIVMGIYKSAGKNLVWLLVNAEKIVNEEGQIINVVCSLTDITERKRLSQELIKQAVSKQKLLVKATIDGQEKERQEIGKELHDNINQYLTTARLYLEVATEKSTGEVHEMIKLSHKTLSDIVKEIRKMSQSLVPPTLGDIGLVESVKELCESIRQAHTIQIDFHYPYFSESGLKENMKLMLFRIVQEQLNNIIRHSEATWMEIKLQEDAENLTLLITDNGKGFDTENYKKGRGLSNISSRANLFNGRLDINSTPGQGCRLIITIPLNSGLDLI